MPDAERLTEAEVARLVGRAQAGDVGAFTALVAHDVAALRRFCRGLAAATDADDLAQEALVRAWRSLPRLGAPYRFRAWLFGIAANLARKAWRRRARADASLEALLADHYDALGRPAWLVRVRALLPAAPRSPEETVDRREDAAVLHRALAALPAALRQVLVLHYLDGLSYAEIGAALAVPVSTVKGRLYKSRARLRGQLAGRLGTPTGAGAPVPHRRPRARPAAKPKEKSMTQGPAEEPVRLVLDREALIDELHAYVTDPSPGRTRRLEGLVIPDLAPLGGRPAPAPGAAGSLRTAIRLMLDVMLLDGVTRRQDVAALIGALSPLSRAYSLTVR